MNQTEGNRLDLRKEFKAHFCSDKNIDTPRKDYKGEWGHAIEDMGIVMAMFDPEGMRSVNRSAKRMAYALTGEILPADMEGYNPITGMLKKVARVEERARELHKRAVSDPNYHDTHTIEGMGDFCGFVSEIGKYLSTMDASDAHASESIDMLVKLNAYDRAYSLNGVPDHGQFSGMVESCSTMMKRLCRDRIKNRY